MLLTNSQDDTREDRLGWFKQGLEKLAIFLSTRKGMVVTSKFMECEHARSDWRIYERAIREWAAKVDISLMLRELLEANFP